MVKQRITLSISIALGETIADLKQTIDISRTFEKYLLQKHGPHNLNEKALLMHEMGYLTNKEIEDILFDNVSEKELFELLDANNKP